MALSQIRSQLRVTFECELEDQGQDLRGGNVKSTVKFDEIFKWGNGTGSGNANRIFHDKRQIAASGNEVLDMTGGSLTYFDGNTLGFHRIRMLLVYALPGNTNDVQVVRDATNGVPAFMADGDGCALPPGGLFLTTYGATTDDDMAVDPGADDELQVVNSAGGSAVDYEVIVLGTEV